MTEIGRIWARTKIGKQKTRQLPDLRISSYSARIRMNGGPLESWEQGESNRNNSERNRVVFRGVKLGGVLKCETLDEVMGSEA